MRAQDISKKSWSWAKSWSQIGEAVIQLKLVCSYRRQIPHDLGRSCSLAIGGFVIIRLFKRRSLTRKASPMIIVGANYHPIWSPSSKLSAAGLDLKSSCCAATYHGKTHDTKEPFFVRNWNAFSKANTSKGFLTWVSDKLRFLASSLRSAPTTYWFFSKACSNFNSWLGLKAVRILFGLRKGSRNSGRWGPAITIK